MKTEKDMATLRQAIVTAAINLERARWSACNKPAEITAARERLERAADLYTAALWH